jgi:hypothetical protein
MGMNASLYFIAQKGHMSYCENKVNNSFIQTDFWNLGALVESRRRARLHPPENVFRRVRIPAEGQLK